MRNITNNVYKCAPSTEIEPKGCRDHKRDLKLRVDRGNNSRLRFIDKKREEKECFSKLDLSVAPQPLSKV